MTAPTMAQLDPAYDFVNRHIGPRESEQAEMLKYIGFDSLDAMTKAVVPSDILDTSPMDLPAPMSEYGVLSHMRELGSKNKMVRTFIGQGYYNNYTPQVVIRNVLENPGWYTAYTPYQAEISQGRLEAIANFQTMVADLTGLHVANASLLDEGTACAEAMSLCSRMAKNKKSGRFFVSKHCHPQTIAVVMTRAKHFGFEIILGDEDTEIPTNIMGALVQYPRTDGALVDYSALSESVHADGGYVVMATDLLALSVLKTPADMGADIAVGTAQRLGVPMGFGGPHAGFMATIEKLQRSLPGRIIGVSVDRLGNPAYRMAMQTREQHIRREKATSNICTAQALLAIMANFYGVYHGAEGLRTIATRTHMYAKLLAQGLQSAGLAVADTPFFDTITVSGNADKMVADALAGGYNIRKINDGSVGIAMDETTVDGDVNGLITALTGKPSAVTLAEGDTAVPTGFGRESDFMTHPVFNTHHSETQLMRYARLLVNKDIALDRSMIPLGSCTMKLNSATEMAPVSFPEFSSIHPFVPAEQTVGYRQMITTLEKWLCATTGYDAMSLQPNAGSQGEYAGLLAIKEYQKSIGQGHRDVCLIPTSAHGTNPASAQMASLQVVAVACDDNGNIDLTDLQAKCDEHADTVSCIMITYPSTHGVFESHVRQVCDVVHNAGGQVYIDGANLNAQVGLSFPGHYGGDVSHLNLHKTFCIPHGGGGPGVGPIGVKSHLAPFMPGHSLVDNGAGADGAVSSAPWGSASILPITYTYIAMMGDDGLRRATQVAILSANYIAKKLEPHYPVLYKGETGYIAHECILDIRDIEQKTGISNEDVAKRLMDYGFHAPTMSFPVAGTLMIEPTESEPLQEIERFCDAMISIAGEIEQVANGTADAQNNVLKNAPHTAHEALGDDWQHSYSRPSAVYPADGQQANKVWPAVGRIDNVYGDRNLHCACIPMSAYTSAS